ncbi:MAG TPA: acyltransferase [Puia sp.]|nr:acyltransferase [Puia sp.]
MEQLYKERHMNKNLPWLQVARGIAALIVVCHHLTAAEHFYFSVNIFSGLFTPGWNAVDFFFVLSGFIIYYIHARDLGHRERWKRYITKRLVRIYPIYWVVAFLFLALVVAGNSNGQVSRSEVSDVFHQPAYLLKCLLLIPQTATPFCYVSWSLCFEVFFYLVFGLGILIGKRALWILPILFFGLNIAQLLSPAIFNGNYWAGFLSANYHLEFLLGMLVAWCHRMIPEAHAARWGVRWLWFPGLLLFALTWQGSLVNETVFGKYSVYSRLGYGSGAALIILAIARMEEIRSNGFNRFLLLLGDASYSLYLIHTLLLAVLFKLFIRLGIHGQSAWVCVLLFVLSGFLCVLTGIAMHLKIEKPLLSVLNKNAPAKLAGKTPVKA